MLSETERLRYARQIALPGMGEAAQEKLGAARVLVIGAGGLGSAALLYLAAAGVGTIGIADADEVDLSNLQRQIIHRMASVGREKTLSAKQALLARNPEISVVTHDYRVDGRTIAQTIAGYDIVIDACDNFDTRFLINDACVQANIPFVHGGVQEYAGQVFTCIPGKTACLRCILPEKPAGLPPSGASVFGPAVGVLSCLQAAEAIRYIAGVGELLTDRILTVDTLNMDFDVLPVGRRSGCPACGESRIESAGTDENPLAF